MAEAAIVQPGEGDIVRYGNLEVEVIAEFKGWLWVSQPNDVLPYTVHSDQVRIVRRGA